MLLMNTNSLPSDLANGIIVKATAKAGRMLNMALDKMLLFIFVETTPSFLLL